MRVVGCFEIKTEEIVVLRTFRKCENKEDTHLNQNTLGKANKCKYNTFK